MVLCRRAKKCFVLFYLESKRIENKKKKWSYKKCILMLIFIYLKHKSYLILKKCRIKVKFCCWVLLFLFSFRIIIGNCFWIGSKYWHYEFWRYFPCKEGISKTCTWGGGGVKSFLQIKLASNVLEMSLKSIEHFRNSIGV